jgi:hypothetical protein
MPTPDSSGKRFSRHIEDFVCENCGQSVSGSGYTNHCPCCLWSKHVDVHPGDRQAQCGGLMAPVAVEAASGSYVLTHRCQKCRIEKRNKLAEGDNFDAVLEISRRQAGSGS